MLAEDHVSTVVVVQFPSRVQQFMTPWAAAHQGFPVAHHLLEFPQVQVHWISDAIQPSHPLYMLPYQNLLH